MVKERIALYPASFNPPTNGHRLVMTKIANNYDWIYAAIGVNPGKPQDRFTFRQREQMLNGMVAKEFPNILVTSFVGLFAVDFADTLGARTIIRGLRNGVDFDSEIDLSHINAGINPKIDTIFIPSSKKFLQVSSSTVIGLMENECWELEVGKIVPITVLKDLEEMQFKKDKEMLSGKWQSLCNRLGIKSDQKGAFEDIFKRYDELHRKYHNVSHLKTCLNELELVRDLAEDPNALEMALWLHEVIYESNIIQPGRKRDDEGKSAQFAVDLLVNKMGLGRDFADKVASLIMATKYDSIPVDKDAKLMTDIDLAIFGRSTRIFDIYEKNIREEYSSFSDDAFVKGRIKVLTSFLPPQRETIYQTPFFQNRYERKAKENLKRSIKKLEKVYLKA